MLKSNGKSGFQTIGILKNEISGHNQSKDIENICSDNDFHNNSANQDQSILKEKIDIKEDNSSDKSVGQEPVQSASYINSNVLKVDVLKTASTKNIEPNLESESATLQSSLDLSSNPSVIENEMEESLNNTVSTEKIDVEQQSDNKVTELEDKQIPDNISNNSGEEKIEIESNNTSTFSEQAEINTPPHSQIIKGKKLKWVLLPLAAIIIVSVVYFLFPKETNDEKYSRFKTLYDQQKYDESIPIIQDLLKEDYTFAYRDYGSMLFKGNGVQMDVTKAIELLDTAATRNDLNAILILAKYYKDQKDWSKSLDYYIKAENLGDTDNYNIIAWIFIEDKNPDFSIDKAIKYANKALNKGNKEALFTLGNIYSHDKKKDYDMAFYWWNKGTIEGSNNCKQHCWDNIGWVYLYGNGCKIDYAKAYDAFSNALRIEPKDSYALYHIGEMYYYGYYVKENEEMALSYLKKASDLGNEDAQKLYAEILRDRKN